jgi:lipopolysaccharide exporter
MRMLVNAIALINMLLLARWLTPSDFGLVAIAIAITAVVTSVTELSLTSALIQHEEPKEEHFHSAWTLNFARGVILAVLICGLAVPTARLYGDTRLISVMLVIGAATLLGGMANPKLAMFSRDLIFWQEFVLGVSQKLVGFAIATVAALVYRSYWALIAGIAVTQVWTMVLSYFLFPFRPRPSLVHAGELLSFSVWLSLSQTTNTLNWKFDQFVIGYFLGGTSLGYYTVGDNLAALPTREATAPLALTLFPAFSRLANEPARLSAAYQQAQALLVMVALPLGCGFALIARPLISLTIGERWVHAVIVVQLLASIFAIQTLASALQPLALAMGQTRLLFYRDSVNLVIRVPLIVVGMLTGGLVGIVCARCVSGLVATMINMAMTRWLLGLSLRKQLAVNIRSLLAVGLMMLGVFLVGQVIRDFDGPVALITKSAAMIAAGAMIYVSVLYVLWRRAGRPDGPENEVMRVLGRILSRDSISRMPI